MNKLSAWFSAHNWSTVLLWTVYLALLGVLLPHTAWAFSQFEPIKMAWLGLVAAIAFEGAIAAFTWRLKQRIEQTPGFRSGKVFWRKLRFRYLNIYSLALLFAIAVSSLANWAHSVEYEQAFTVFAKYQIPPLLYTIAFGAILPVCSLLFAHTLADVQDSEQEVDADLIEAKAEVKRLRHELTTAKQELQQAEGAARLLFELTAEDKARRIVAAHQQWPDLPQVVLAQISGASPSYVSQVLNADGDS